MESNLAIFHYIWQKEKIVKYQNNNLISLFPLFLVYCEYVEIAHNAHRVEILYSRGRISTCKTVYIEFLCFVLLSVPVE